MVLIKLAVKSTETDVAVVKLKAPGGIELILLYDKETIDRDGNLEIWLGTLVNRLEDASIEITGLNPGTRNASKMRLSCESFTYLELQSIRMLALYESLLRHLQGEIDVELGQIRSQHDGLNIATICISIKMQG